MEKDINELFDALSAEEADRLIRDIVPETTGEELASRLNEKVKAVLPAGESKLRIIRPRRRALWIAAAVLAVLIALSVGTYAYAADAKEYKEAKAFCIEHGIPVDKLSRGEIKSVYRDITSELDVDMKILKYDPRSEETSCYTIEGCIIPHEEISAPQNEDELWEQYNTPGQHYYLKRNIVDEYTLKDNTVFIMYGDQLIGSFRDEEIDVWNVMKVSDGFILQSRYPRERYTEDYVAPEYTSLMIIRLDESCNEIWRAMWNDGLTVETFRTVTELGDGSLLVTTSGEKFNDKEEIIGSAVCSCRIDKNGNVTKLTRDPDCEEYVWDINPTDGGYIGVSCLYSDTMMMGPALLSSYGKIIKTAKFSVREQSITVGEVLEYDGRLYVCCNFRDMNVDYPEEVEYDHRNDPEIITPLAKKMYSALLLVCDLDSFEPISFYKIEGARNTSITIDENGLLKWDVGLIYGAVSSDGSIVPKCSEYSCSFDENENPVIFSDLRAVRYH